jgi:mono/diheme cytochrome c family protein
MRLPAVPATAGFMAAALLMTALPCFAAEPAPVRYPAGAATFQANCAVCHGAKGAGTPSLAPPITSYPARYAGNDEGVPPLAHALGRYMRTPAGRNYVLRVPGAANSALSDAQLAAVLNWLAQTFDRDELSSDVPLFSVAEVKGVRHSPLASVLATRREVVRELGATGHAPPASY